eukprot:1091825-Pyramimonas_sp.AAC.1
MATQNRNHTGVRHGAGDAREGGRSGGEDHANMRGDVAQETTRTGRAPRPEGLLDASRDGRARRRRRAATSSAPDG